MSIATARVNGRDTQLSTMWPRPPEGRSAPMRVSVQARGDEVSLLGSLSEVLHAAELALGLGFVVQRTLAVDSKFRVDLTTDADDLEARLGLLRQRTS